jgi:predicted MPP superfamily phosphohydrolase
MLRSPVVFRTLFVFMTFFIFAYPPTRLSEWAGAGIAIGWSGSIALWLLGTIGMWYSFSGPKMIVRYLVVHWMGASFIFAVLVLGYEILRLPFSFDDAAATQWIVIIGLLLILVALVASHYLKVKKIEIRSPKLTQRHRIVQISDVHIGSRQGGFMARVVNRINDLSPDIVVITGDLIDSSAVEIESLKPLERLQAKTYFSIGNHERYANLTKALEMLESLGVVPLRQASRIDRELQLIGIDDADHHGHVAEQLPSVDIDRAYFTVLLYHRPVGWEAAIGHGIDLMLSGHTHNGQIFPFNYVVRQQFARISGLYRQQDAHLYVSSGTGTWGPLMRLGSFNEISCFDLIPEDKIDH